MPAVNGEFVVLCVCTANICRSPVAAAVLGGELDSADRPFRVHSAGVRGLDGRPMDSPAAALLAEWGYSAAGFRARSISAGMCEVADLVLTATRQQRSAVLASAPRALRRTFTLLEFAQGAAAAAGSAAPAGGPAGLVARVFTGRGTLGIEEYDLPDPFGQPAAEYQRILRRVRVAAMAVASALADA